jgi:hypothetical protein
MALDWALANKATLEAKRKGPAADAADYKARLARFDAELAGLRDTLKQFGTPPIPSFHRNALVQARGRRSRLAESIQERLSSFPSPRRYSKGPEGGS